MTKQSSDEIIVKCSINLDQTEKIESRIAGTLNKSSLAIHGSVTRNEIEIKPKVNQVVACKEIGKTRLEKIMSELHDIENNSEQEKHAKIDLDINLYQMEEQ